MAGIDRLAGPDATGLDVGFCVGVGVAGRVVAEAVAEGVAGADGAVAREGSAPRAVGALVVEDGGDD